MALCLVISHVAWGAPDGEKSLLAVVGDPLPEVRVGHRDHCTEMQKIDPAAMDKSSRVDVALVANETNWISLAGRANGQACESTLSFVPEANAGYIARFSKAGCLTELYQVKKGAAPIIKVVGNDSDASKLVCASAADPAGVPRLAAQVTGDDIVFSVGQKGYCGAMQTVDVNDKAGAALKANERNWVRLIYFNGRNKAEYNFSFIPTSGNSYLFNSNIARASLFRASSNAKLVPETLTKEEPRSCLFGE